MAPSSVPSPSPAPGTAPSRARRRAVRGALVALARARLRGTTGSRLGRLFATMACAGFGLIALALRIGDGEVIAFAGLLETACGWIAWLAGAPIALAAAHHRAAADRADGIDALAATRGAAPAAIEASRVIGAMLHLTLAIGVPAVALALFTAALSGSPRVVLLRLAMAGAVACFAAIAGVTLGGVAAFCGRVGAAHGRSLLLAVVLGPWLVADFFGRASASIPGALGAVLGFALRLASDGGSA